MNAGVMFDVRELYFLSIKKVLIGPNSDDLEAEKQTESDSWLENNHLYY